MTHSSIFRNFEPNRAIQAYANFVIRQILKIVHPRAEISSWVERHGVRYVCTIEVVSRRNRFKATSFAINPILALDKSRRMLSEQLREWGIVNYSYTT